MRRGPYDDEIDWEADFRDRRIGDLAIVCIIMAGAIVLGVLFA